MASDHSSEQTPTLSDWLLFALLVAVGGSSFAMIRGAVETVPPVAVTVGRLWVGAVFTYIVMRQAGRHLPPLIDPNGGGLHREWRWMAAVSLIGYVVPFLIFPWAQQHIESGLAGIYMAFMPIWTVGFAYLFAGESLTGRKICGFALGLVGVIILIGPSVFGQAAQTNILAQIMLLIATLGYAASAVLTRNAPPIRPRIFATGCLLISAIITTPILFFIDLKMDEWSLTSIINVVALGFGPTGLAGVLLIVLIQRIGAGFMALANYLTPLWAVGLGALSFGERLGINALAALIIILAGVAIAQRGQKKPPPTIAAQNTTDRPDQTKS